MAVKPFKFELTISGLCLLAVKSSEPNPKEPEAVDIICPNAHMHRPRLSYDPVDLRANVEPDMDVDEFGNRASSLDLSRDIRHSFLNFTFTTSPHKVFTMKWGEEQEEPANTAQERRMNWLPSLGILGFGDFRMPGAGQLPPGASARITLPPGDVVCADVIKVKDDPKKYVRWEFPASADKAKKTPPIVRAVANAVVFRASGVTTLVVTDRHGMPLLSGGPDKGDTLRMCISNDMAMVPTDYNDVHETLEHLGHLDVLAPLHNPPFRPPKMKKKGQRTGEPICDGVIMIYDEGSMEKHYGQPAYRTSRSRSAHHRSGSAAR